MTLAKIRIGLVGCVRVSKNHFNAIQSFNDKLTLLTVCDENDSSLHPAMYGQNVVLTSEDIDLLICCTLFGLHAVIQVDK
jgi:UDP-N-acetyl-2-amino-2-deoxyglucuronate dehydrogenase